MGTDVYFLVGRSVSASGSARSSPAIVDTSKQEMHKMQQFVQKLSVLVLGLVAAGGARAQCPGPYCPLGQGGYYGAPSWPQQSYYGQQQAYMGSCTGSSFGLQLDASAYWRQPQSPWSAASYGSAPGIRPYVTTPPYFPGEEEELFRAQFYTPQVFYPPLSFTPGPLVNVQVQVGSRERRRFFERFRR
jgi:hypothetical protein